MLFVSVYFYYDVAFSSNTSVDLFVLESDAGGVVDFGVSGGDVTAS